MAPQNAFAPHSRSNASYKNVTSKSLLNPMIRPPTSEIAREDKLWVKEWAHWRHYHAILTYNFDQTGVLQLYRHEHKDADPHRLIQMNDFVKVYASRNSSNRFEFTIEEKTGLEIVMATDNSGDRSAWITSFNVFIKMEKLVLNLESFDLNDKSKVSSLGKPTDKDIKQSVSKDDIDFIKSQLLHIKQNLIPAQDTSLLTKISNQLEKQNLLLEQLSSSNVTTREMKPNVSEKSMGILISNMNDKLTRLLSAVDYITDRISTSLKRDQDIMNTQTQLANQIEQNYNELKSLKTLVSKDDSFQILIESLEKRLFTQKSVMNVCKVNSSDTVFECENS